METSQKLTNVIQTSQNSPWLSLRSLNKWYGVFAPQYYKFSQPCGLVSCVWGLFLGWLVFVLLFCALFWCLVRISVVSLFNSIKVTCAFSAHTAPLPVQILMCDNFERACWVELLSPGDPDSDAFDEELQTELP